MNLSEAIKKLKNDNELCLERCEGECEDCNYKDSKCYCADSIIVRALEEYIKIGTVEECREARERQKGKKPVCRSIFTDGTRFPGCPTCFSRIDRGAFYCSGCGQKLDWHL